MIVDGISVSEVCMNGEYGGNILVMGYGFGFGNLFYGSHNHDPNRPSCLES